MAAESVDPQLRADVHRARAKGIRCFQLRITSGGDAGNGGHEATGKRTLAPASAAREEPDAALTDEFARCVAAAAHNASPCLFLFRADECENIDGSRWLLVAWLPKAAPEAERVAYIRSRGLLAQLVPEPYYLQEFFSHSRSGLTWAAVLKERSGDGGRGAGAAKEGEPHGRAAEVLACAGLSRPPPTGPVVLTPACRGLLQRFAQREEACLRLQLFLDPTARQGKSPTPLTLDAKVCESWSPSQLSKSNLPMAPCYFVMNVREDIFFLYWCPDSPMLKDSARSWEDGRYAVFQASAIQAVLAAFPLGAGSSAPPPPSRVLRAEAREPQDIVDGFGRASEVSSPCVPSARTATDPDGWQAPPPGATQADWPADWPTAATASVMPASMLLPAKPVPPWRGGRKAHTIGSSAPPGSGHRSKLGRMGSIAGYGRDSQL